MLWNCISVEEVVAIIATLILTILIYFKWTYSYWARKKLDYLPPTIPFGNLSNYLTNPKSRAMEYGEIYQECKKRGYKHAGIWGFTSPMYMPVDLDYVKNVLLKDSQNFVDRGAYYNEKDQPISAHLFALGGAKWKNLRAKLSPSFSSGKLKMMFPLVLQCTKSMKEVVDGCVAKKDPIDVKEISASFTTDVVGTCAYGLDCNSQKNSEIRKMGRLLFPSNWFNSLKFSFCFAFQSLSRALGLVIFDRRAEKYFVDTVIETVNYREENGVTRQDFLQLLMELKRAGALSMDELTAQCFVFFVAGFETSSGTMTHCLYELAIHQDVQNRLRKEIDQVVAKYGGFSYEAVMEMKYLQQVLNETLRKYPSVPFLTRKCSQKYKIPDTEVTIDEGTQVAISVFGIHYDSDYYPDPEKFDPERFSVGNKENRNSCSFLPFGEGPRNCIGLRFGLMQTKIGICTLLRDYRFVLNLKTKTPVELDLGATISIKGGVWLNAVKLN